MAKIMIINGSPRAPKSNSKRYAELFAKACPAETEYFAVSKTNHLALCRAMQEVSDVLLVFPLYADGIPVTLMRFLDTLAQNTPRHPMRISVMLNCGFLEPEQNDVAVKMLRLYCRQNGFAFGSVLQIGSGEAILATPFRILVRAKIKRLAAAMLAGQERIWKVTMPLSKGLFLKASTRYWVSYGKRNGVTKEQMATMQIEG